TGAPGSVSHVRSCSGSGQSTPRRRRTLRANTQPLPANVAAHRANARFVAPPRFFLADDTSQARSSNSGSESPSVGAEGWALARRAGRWRGGVERWRRRRSAESDGTLNCRSTRLSPAATKGSQMNNHVVARLREVIDRHGDRIATRIRDG